MPCRGRPHIYAFKHMWIGGSVFISDQPLGSQSKPAKSALAYGRRNGMKFKARTEGNGVRIWRIK